jgi:2-amino-4-hydroxy-6-hydroxymethyldihydropteridine diphosphokinase
LEDIHTVFIASGSNLGERLENLRMAVASLPPEITVVACSAVYQTEPWGFRDQPFFLNQVVQGTTRLGPAAVLTYLKAIEKDLGRVPTFKDGPRLIDLDILFYDQAIVETGELTIPHPRLEGRAFVLVPLAELAPDKIHPVTGLSVVEMLAKVDTSGVEFFAPADC